MPEDPIDVSGAISLYLDLAPNATVDLEVAATMAIQWSRAVKAAGIAIDPEYEYRVSLIAAKPGSSNWLAKIERSRINQAVQRIHDGWERLPLILRLTIALAVVVPTTAVPTWEYWTDSASFSQTQLEQMEEAFKKATDDPAVKEHKRKMFKDALRDPKITGIGGGVPSHPDWKPDQTVPANQFAEAEGLFEPQEGDLTERTLTQVLDVILVAPDLENAHKTWVFRQQGIPGNIRAIMKDDQFLAGLEQSAVKESLRTEIPMTIRLEIKEQMVDGQWKVKRRGRSVVKVLSPKLR